MGINSFALARFTTEVSLSFMAVSTSPPEKLCLAMKDERKNFSLIVIHLTGASENFRFGIC